MTASNNRLDQMFPVLSSVQMATAKRFAAMEPQKFAAGETVFGFGDRDAPLWLVLEGALEIYRHDGPAKETQIVIHMPGHFSGEVSQLVGRPSLVRGMAGADGCLALPFDAAHLRALVIGSADIGEVVMRAFILRRVALIDEGGAGSTLVGIPGSQALTRLQGFLTRSGYPHLVLDATLDEEGQTLVKKLGIAPEDLPMMLCPNGTVLKHPSDLEAAICLGITPELKNDVIYDVAVIGAGPAGLAAAVYAASEGLKVIVLDERATGGQAGASARIENYLGFPTGISGQALAGRAFNQALKFGAEVALPLEVLDFEPAAETSGSCHTLHLTGGRIVRGRTVVIASGAKYRRPDVADIETYEGAGISYWATPVEARLCQGEEIALVGGGNSAGQAVAFLAPQVKQLHLLVRRPLHDTMSQYLIDRIAALPNVTTHVGCEIEAVSGTAHTGLSGALIRDASAGGSFELTLRHMFLFIGAIPNAGWLKEHVLRDRAGFIRTGGEASSDLKLGRQSLETSVRNLFAIGDVRSGSTKRVAAAVGEGAAVVAQIHAALKLADGDPPAVARA
ncbi:cyclic nucleotide-binding domain-containing protein [Neorhizobium lilium]|uniref:Thioredoxin reductase n=1 Tax=Neorhizobium lilium TaxID=2503024 RepID=A0A444LND3_9HYPH|nr:FAD-dependent oxidoreductase [Neorhizobium lilium]RWX81778.1 cyclic nucleotide-binding domain-containing protein [Neorhizobium lilium]